MFDVYQKIYENLKVYVETNSIFKPKVVKKAPKSSPYLPIVEFKEASNIERDRTTNKEEYFNKVIYTVQIYTQEQTLNKVKYPSEAQRLELVKLIDRYLGDVLKLVRSVDRKIDNIDETIDRQYVEYVGTISSISLRIN